MCAASINLCTRAQDHSSALARTFVLVFSTGSLHRDLLALAKPNASRVAMLAFGRISHFKFRPDRAFRTENMGLGNAPNPRWMVENVAEHDGCPMLQDSEDGDRSRHHLHDAAHAGVLSLTKRSPDSNVVAVLMLRVTAL